MPAGVKVREVDVDARITVFGSLTPTSGPRANPDSYSTLPVADGPLSVVVMTCSHPMVQLAQWAFFVKWAS